MGPTHKGVEGNEVEDDFAKQAAESVVDAAGRWEASFENDRDLNSGHEGLDLESARRMLVPVQQRRAPVAVSPFLSVQSLRGPEQGGVKGGREDVRVETPKSPIR